MSHPHWQYFLTLDEDLYQLSRYIEISQDNFSTYSVELVRIILSACSEIDVVAKLLYPHQKGDNIQTYTEHIPRKFPNLPGVRVEIPAHGMILEPWKAWASGNVPSWWTNHNAIKHSRADNYPMANLENAINAVAGLLVLVAYLYRVDWDEDKLDPQPRLIHLDEKYERINVILSKKPLP